MTHKPVSLSRRDFLKSAAVSLAAAALPRFRPDDPGVSDWPDLGYDRVPDRIVRLMEKVPRMRVDSDGYLILQNERDVPLGRTPLAQTQWNRENSSKRDRMDTGRPWAIVLHWYGDRENFDKTVAGYLRGFDSEREIYDYVTRTSAHFLVGWEKPLPGVEAKDDEIGILQTQLPDEDGIPFIASHLAPVNYKAYVEDRHYFVRALDSMALRQPWIGSVLQSFFSGRRFDPNAEALAIEICGYDFENPVHWPGDQQIANVVGLVWALMKRYQVRASDILGHNEIQLSKPDPGKKLTSLVRYLIGIKALLEQDEHMLELVFGQFRDLSTSQAVRRYFRYVRDYLVMVASQQRVYEWEALSHYWFFYPSIDSQTPALPWMNDLVVPVHNTVAFNRDLYLQPEHHEGIDISRDLPRHSPIKPGEELDVYLMGQGICLNVGESLGHCCGRSAIFRHLQPDGSQVLTLYGHLHNIGDLQAGERYPAGYRIGAAQAPQPYIDSYVHFSIAYGATWDTDLVRTPRLPLNAGTTWIQQRFLEPRSYLNI